MMSNDLVNFLSFEGGYSNGQPKQYFHVCRTRAITSFPDPEPIVPVPTSITEVKKNGALSVLVTAGVATLTAPKAIKAVEVFTLMGEKLPRSGDNGRRHQSHSQTPRSLIPLHSRYKQNISVHPRRIYLFYDSRITT